MIILGLDPGTTIVGYGVIKKEKGQFNCLDYGIIISRAKEKSDKLLNIHKQINRLLKKYQPDILATEKIFFFKNVKSATMVSEARGIILLTAALNNTSIREYTPLQVKQAITGYGKADKAQIQKMVKILLNLSSLPQPDDAADALALAICAANSMALLP